MKDRMKFVLKTIDNEERGYVMLLVLILMVLGTLIVIPFLGFMSTGTSTGQVFEKKTNELYAANAGIEDGRWQIKYNHLKTTFADYSPYDYGSSWSYELTEKVNGYNVDTTIKNYWIPKGLTSPSESDAEYIIEGVDSNPPMVIITGTVSDPSTKTYEIKIQYYPHTEEELEIATVGVWLPVGFTYVDGSCILEDDPYGFTPPDVGPWAGGYAVTWDCDSYPFAGNDLNSDDDYDDLDEQSPFPGVYPADTPMVSTLTFQYSGSDRTPEIISWIDTNLDLTQGDGFFTTYSWDTDMKVYKVSSMAGDTEIEAYIPKSEMRELGAVINGDYKAVGNSLMDRSNNSYRYRDILLAETDATVDDIPSDAFVELAYLYWSGWYDGQELVADTNAIFKIDIDMADGVYDYEGEITADSYGDRVQVINNSDHGNPHGYSYSCRKDVTTLIRAYSDSGSGNATYTVGGVDATWDIEGEEWAYAGWSLVIIYSSIDTVGHQLYLYDDFLYKDHDDTFLDFDQDGSEGGIIDGFFVPEPVIGEVDAARITAFVGEGDVWYTGDYLEFEGSKLWDGTNTNHNSVGHPDNCWNGESVGMSAEGVDVDTFHITWDSGLLTPGETSANIDIWTDVDIWNLVYIILSFRSETTTGDLLGFLVH